MNENEKLAIGLLEERNQLLYEVLGITEPVNLDKDDIEKYVELIEARQEKFDRLYEIDEELKTYGYGEMTESGSKEFLKASEDLYNSARATAYRINEIDLSRKPIVEEIKTTFMEELKTVNERRSARNLYSDNSTLSATHYFDKTK